VAGREETRVADDVVAQAPAGRLRGVRDGRALRFLGVPYAQSPQVTGRFAAPVPHPRWDGVRDALDYGATSPQPERGVTVIPEPLIPGDNELNLNVFTPDLGAAGLPVLVWIHGGGFAAGASSSPWYRGQGFARDGVVLVTINYRLGAPGFLQIPDAPVNRGLLDWVRALEWVHENIAAFGGDPARVTVAGQSAGGGACAALPGVPAAAGLFRGLICMSGGPAMLQTADGVQEVARQVSEYLGVPLSQAALEGLSSETILAAQAGLMAPPGDPHSPDSVRRALEGIKLPWAPWVDGEVLATGPWQATRSGQHRAIPLLTGGTASEVNASWMHEDWVTPDMVRSGLEKAGVAQPQLDRYLGQLAGLRPGEMVGQAVGDRTFRVEVQELAAAKAAAGGAAYVYDFRWGSRADALRGRAIHSLEIPFVFDTLGEAGVTDVAGEAPPQRLASDMHAAWVRFVTDGEPGWSRYEAGPRPVMVFAEDSAVQDDPLRLERAVWSELITQGT
jgi:para-nitrobenzyl esterase